MRTYSATRCGLSSGMVYSAVQLWGPPFVQGPYSMSYSFTNSPCATRTVLLVDLPRKACAELGISSARSPGPGLSEHAKPVQHNIKSQNCRNTPQSSSSLRSQVSKSHLTAEKRVLSIVSTRTEYQALKASDKMQLRVLVGDL